MAVPQLANIAFGFFASLPLLSKIEQFKEPLEKLHNKFKDHEVTFSYIVIALCLINLADRFFFSIPFFSGSYPQSLGLFLLFLVFTNMAFFSSFQKTLSPFKEWIGVLAFLIGLFSLI